MPELSLKTTLLTLACALSLLGSGCQSDFESGLVVGAGLTGLVVGTIALVSEVNTENTPAPSQSLNPSGHNRPGGIRYIFVRDQPVYSSFNSGSVSTGSNTSATSPAPSSSTGTSGHSDSDTQSTSSSSDHQHRSSPPPANTSSSSSREVVIEPATTQDALLELPEWIKP